MAVLALIGTGKGLFFLHGDSARKNWRAPSGPVLAGWGVYHAVVDPRDGTMYAAANHLVYGPTVQRSIDGGATWTRSKQLRVPERFGLTVNRTWHVEPGRRSEPDTLFLGGDPALLFRSDDGAETWEPNLGLLEHPSREKWFPGAGGMSCHSIQLDPDDADRMYIGITAAGTFRTDDGGKSWMPRNANVAADYLPFRYPDVGQCVHKLLLHPARPKRLWQQTHVGVYRSDDGADSWERLDENGLPSSFGFTIMLDPRDPDTALVIPEESSERHYAPNGQFGVYRTRDGGHGWTRLGDGLPERAWAAVLRDASAFDERSAYFGTQSGFVYALGEDDRWTEAARHLPPILSIEVTEWSA